MAAVLLAGSALAGGTLTVCTEAAPDVFDIAQSVSAATVDTVGSTIFDQLVLVKPGATDLIPGLAERWDISADGLQYTMHLRPGVKFHTTPWFKPTREMNADDVVFSIGRLMDPKSPWLKMALNGFLGWNALGMSQIVKAVEKQGAMSVRFTLNKPTATFLNLLSESTISSVYPAEYGAQLIKSGKLEAINKQPVGTGPYVFRSYQKDAVLRLAAHPGYWGGAPKIDHLLFAVTPDANVRVQRLKAGECLVGANMGAGTLGTFAGTPIKVLETTPLMTAFINVNTTRPFLSDQRFREALLLGFDKQSTIKAVYDGKALPAATFLPPVLWSHDATLPSRYDPQRAKALVKASGYDGTEFTIATRIGGSIDAKRAQSACISVKVRIQMMDAVEVFTRTGRGEYDISFYNWAGGSDPDFFLKPMLGCAAIAAGSNAPQWCNKGFDDLLAAALATTDRAQRTALYVKAQRMVFDEVALIPTVFPLYFTAVHQRVKGFVMNPNTVMELRAVSVDEAK